MRTARFVTAVLTACAFGAAVAGPASASTLTVRTASSPSCSRWTVTRPPNPSSALDALSGVAVLSASNIWAVGDDAGSMTGPFRTLIEHWTGHAWKRVPSPNPGIGSDYLNSVTAVSPSNIWAAGEYSDQSGGITPDKTLILHWNGRTWKKVSSPNPGRSFDSLGTIRAVSATSVWAVGTYAGSDFHDRSFALHSNGHAWSKVPSPNPGKFSDSLSGLAIGSASSIWTAEFFTRKSGTNALSQILRWNGHSWHVSAAPAETELVDLSASSKTNAWAVGDDSKGHSLALHWNGRSWKRVSTPNIKPNSLINALQSVTVVSPTSAWAVGAAQNVFSVFEGTAIEMHWNGRKWSLMTNPFTGTANSAMFGVQATAKVSPWAVGEDGDSNTVQRTLALRCR